jgi:NTP pyrophosphatase (non-canonical NTP hydrolase)
MTTLDDLQARCSRTSLKKTEPNLSLRERQAAVALWLCSEAGEVADVVRKWTLSPSNTDLRLKDIRDELGDVLWCVSELTSLLGLTLEECAEAQRSKQEKRYGHIIKLHDTEGP